MDPPSTRCSEESLSQGYWGDFVVGEWVGEKVNGYLRKVLELVRRYLSGPALNEDGTETEEVFP